MYIHTYIHTYKGRCKHLSNTTSLESHQGDATRDPRLQTDALRAVLLCGFVGNARLVIRRWSVAQCSIGFHQQQNGQETRVHRPGLAAKTIYCVVYGVLVADHGFSAPSPRESHEVGKDRLGSRFMAGDSKRATHSDVLVQKFSAEGWWIWGKCFGESGFVGQP